MGKIVEKQRKKKKGRPSLLDLQKRSLKQQKPHQQHDPKLNASTPKSSLNYNTATPPRRSTSRKGEDDDDESDVEKKKKQPKFVLKLKSAEAAPSNSSGDEIYRKRKIDALGDGSSVEDGEKGDQSAVGADNGQGVGQLDLEPSTPLPDKKLLLFILDRLQKKDTYGVFAEPVDSEELPDYHEIIKLPMDFQTIRKKLDGGAYASLEQFEKDVFLLCSNAMQYNAPDTIYFRQARSIEELAKKNFANLRQDSDDDDDEPEPKVARRGRPPTKSIFKKLLGKPSLEHAGTDFSSDATPDSITDLSSDKTRIPDSSGRLHCSPNVYTSWLSGNKFERSDEGFMMKGSHSAKNGKKQQFVFDESRRNTYKQFHPSTNRQEPSVLATFSRERKQLLSVGLHTEHGYGRSLARFTAQFGSVAWKLGARRIKKCLAAGVKFGPGWVGENDITPQKPLLNSQCLFEPSSLRYFSGLDTLSSAASSFDKVSEEPVDVNPAEKQMPCIQSATTTSSSVFHAGLSPEPHTVKAEAGFNVPNTNSAAIRPGLPVQIHPGTNGFNGGYEFNLPPAQTLKPMEAMIPTGFSFHPKQVPGTGSQGKNNFVQPATTNNHNLENSQLSENSVTTNSNSSLPATSSGPQSRQPRPDSGLPQRPETNPAPPDLNIRFQSPGSPNCCRVDSTQPDLVLQL